MSLKVKDVIKKLQQYNPEREIVLTPEEERIDYYISMITEDYVDFKDDPVIVFYLGIGSDDE